MNRRNILIVLTIILSLSGIYVAVLRPVQGVLPPPWTVSLDANSTSAMDANPQATNTVTKTFRIGAMVNASGAAGVCGSQCISGVFGWQLGIVYDNTTVVPQGDPSATSLYPDGAENTVSFGAQSTAGDPNWGSLV